MSQYTQKGFPDFIVPQTSNSRSAEQKPSKKPLPETPAGKQSRLFAGGKIGGSQRLYSYRPLPKQEPGEIPKPLEHEWEMIIDDIRYGIELESKNAGKKDEIGEVLKQFIHFPPGSPFFALMVAFVRGYENERNALKHGIESNASLMLDALLAIIPELETIQEISETNQGSFTTLSGLSVRRRIKIKYVPHPIFMGINGSVPLLNQEMLSLSGLTELQLYLLESLAHIITEHKIPLEEQFAPLIELLSKIADADKPSSYIQPGCRAAFLAALPSWWDEGTGGYHLSRHVSQDTPFDANTPLPVRQCKFLHSLRSKGTRSAFTFKGKEKITDHETAYTIARIMGKLIQNIILPNPKLLHDAVEKHNQWRLEDLRKILEPYHEALSSLRSLWQTNDGLLLHGVREHAFAPGGEFASLLEKTAHAIARIYLNTHYQLPTIEEDIDHARSRMGISEDANFDTEKVMGQTEMAALMELDETFTWNHLINIFGSWSGGKGAVDIGNPGEAFPDKMASLETPEIKTLEGPQKIHALEQATTQWLMRDYYNQIQRFVLFFVAVSRLINREQERVPTIPGKIIPEITLYQGNDDQHHAPVYCDGIVLPSDFDDPSETENRRLGTILNNKTPPISIVEVKTIISLHGFPNPPQNIRKQEKDQIEKYLAIMKRGYPNVPVEYVYLYYITFNQTRLLRYLIREDGTIDYEDVTEIKS